MHENPLEFFDTILRYLLNNNHKTITFRELIENVFPQTKPNGEPYEIVENIFEDTDRSKILANALLYLKELKFVSYHAVKPVTDITVLITQQGVLKIKTNSFSKEHDRTVWNHRIERINKIVTPIIALCAFGLSLYNYFFSHNK